MTDHIGLVVTSKCLPIVNPCKNMQNMVYCIRLVYNRAVFYVTIFIIYIFVRCLVLLTKQLASLYLLHSIHL